MKKIYKLILFLMIFQFAVIIVNATGVFPNTFYSDSELPTNIANAEGPEEIFMAIFPLPDFPGLSLEFEYFSFAAILFLVMILGAAAYRISHSWTPLITAVIVTSFLPMILSSWTFFSKLFNNWDNMSMMYMGLCIGVGIVIIAVITVLEVPAQGDA